MIQTQKVKIGDIGDIKTGKTPPTNDDNNYGNDYMFIGPTDLHKHYIIEVSEKMISEKGLNSIKGSVLNGLSVLVGCIGWDMGNVALVNGTCATNQQINSITNIKSLYNPYYIYYWLKNNKQLLFQLANVTRTPILNKTDFSNIEIEVPSKSRQDEVVKILTSIDSKIALNNRINAELEAMAKTVYDYWFVQFDFPNAEGNPYKSSGGKMVWCEELKREVPEGWEVGTLSDLGDIVGGSTPPREVNEYFCNNGTAWITPKDLSLNQGNKFITKGELDVSESGIKAASLNILPKGTILLSSRAPIGYLAISREEVTTNQGFKSFVPSKGYSAEYVYYSIKNMIPTIENNAVGSTFKEVSASTLKSIKVCLAQKEVVEEYNKRVTAIFHRQDVLEQENQQLSSLRDWLLPMLMNGQVSVGDIQT